MTETYIKFLDRTDDAGASFAARTAIEPVRRASRLDTRLIGGLLGLLPVALLWLSGTSCADAMPFTPQICAVESADRAASDRMARADGADLSSASVSAPAIDTVQL